MSKSEVQSLSDEELKKQWENVKEDLALIIWEKRQGDFPFLFRIFVSISDEMKNRKLPTVV